MSDFEQDLARDLPRGVPLQPGQLVDANWLDPLTLASASWKYRDDSNRCAGLLLGYRNGRAVGLLDDRHALTIAGSRAGKGVSLIVPNLLTYDGSVVAIDPKGELARITARARREKGQNVVILDPFGTNGRYPSHSFNPLDELDPASPTIADDAGVIADALITGNERDPHWTDSAAILIQALILYVLTGPKEERNLVTVRRLLALSHPAIDESKRKAKISGDEALCYLLIDAGKAFNGLVAGVGESFRSMADRERSSVLSTARTQTKFLDSDSMVPVLSRSDVKLADIKRKPTTVYLCLPATRMGTHARWLRVMINLALIAFEREKAVPAIPTLLLLDEFPVLGQMRSIETAAGLMAGFGVKMWVVAQDITQLQRLYAKSWETFIGNAGVLTLWSNTDAATLKYISEKLGQTNVRLAQPSGASAPQRLAGSSGTREELRVQRLAAPDELERILARETGRILVLAAGRMPVILKRTTYYRDEGFSGRFDSNT